MKKILIIGGVAGGAATAARLRRNDESSRIIMFERGPHISYANCGLPYYIGNVITDRDELFVQTAQEFSLKYNIDVRTDSEVIAVDTAKKTVNVVSGDRKYDETYDTLVLSPGAKPFIPQIKGADLEHVFTVRNVCDTDRIISFIKEHKPENAVVIGAGYVGLEMAENLKHICSKVTVVEMADRVIPFFDHEIAAMIEQKLAENGIKVLLNSKAALISNEKVELSSGESLTAEIVILAAGVAPDTGFLKGSGIELTKKGCIVVDDYLQTTVPGVYALGDAIFCYHKVLDEKLSIYLAGPASKQARAIADNISEGKNYSYGGTVGTAIIKVSDMTAGYAGISEDSLKRQKKTYIASFTHGLSNAGYYPGAMPLTLKLLFNPENGLVYGAQIVGYKGVDKRLDVIAALIYKNGTVTDLMQYDHAYAPPYSSAKDPLTIAGQVADNIMRGKVKIRQWYEIEDESDDYYLVDVRNEDEYQCGHLQDSVLIPLKDFRNRLREIPKQKKVLIYCRSGHRAYIACRILMQNGYDAVYNLSGGYLTYQAAKKIGCCSLS